MSGQQYVLCEIIRKNDKMFFTETECHIIGNLLMSDLKAFLEKKSDNFFIKISDVYFIKLVPDLSDKNNPKLNNALYSIKDSEMGYQNFLIMNVSDISQIRPLRKNANISKTILS